MPRTTKLTPERQARICQAIKLGATYELAAHYGGIHSDTMTEWMKHRPTFAEAVRDAEGQAAVIWLAKIEQAASDGNWQAAAWKLERRYPGMYGRTVQEHQGADGGPIKVELSDVKSQLLARVAGIRERRRSAGGTGEPTGSPD